MPGEAGARGPGDEMRSAASIRELLLLLSVELSALMLLLWIMRSLVVQWAIWTSRM